MAAAQRKESVMEPATGNRLRCSFGEANLRVGDSLHIELPRMLDKVRAPVTLVGWVEGHFLIVTTPKDYRLQPQMLANEDVLLRTFNGRNAYAFRAEVLRSVQSPVAHLYLTYPDSVESVTVRKAPRCRVDLAVQMVMGDSSVDGTLRNLSAEGALVESDVTLQAGDVIDCIPLAFDLHGVPVEMEVQGIVRSARTEPNATVHQYGIEFTDLKAADRLALAGYVTSQILDKPANTA